MSFTFDPRNMLLFQICFSFSRAKEGCEILLRTSDFEQSSETSEACYSVHRLPFYLDVPLGVIGTGCHQFVLLSTDLHLIPCAVCVETFA